LKKLLLTYVHLFSSMSYDAKTDTGASSDGDDIVYLSNEAIPKSYWLWSYLWCGYCESDRDRANGSIQLTTQDVSGSRVNSMLENLRDVTSNEKCCWSVWNCCPRFDDFERTNDGFITCDSLAENPADTREAFEMKMRDLQLQEIFKY